MFCKYCGNEMDNDAMFCPKCGQKVETKDYEIKNKNPDSDADSNPTHKKENKVKSKHLANVLRAILVLAIIGAGYFTYHKIHTIYEKKNLIAYEEESSKLYQEALIQLKNANETFENKYGDWIPTFSSLIPAEAAEHVDKVALDAIEVSIDYYKILKKNQNKPRCYDVYVSVETLLKEISIAHEKRHKVESEKFLNYYDTKIRSLRDKWKNASYG